MRYDGPNFEKEGFVSVWISKVGLEEIPNDYFEERYGEEFEDVPLSKWCGSFGFGYYDHDQIEDNGIEAGRETLDKLIGECSYSLSYLEQAIIKAKEQGLDKASWIRNLFDYAYEPEKTRIKEDQYMLFLGSFEYNDESDSKYDPEL